MDHKPQESCKSPTARPISGTTWHQPSCIAMRAVTSLGTGQLEARQCKMPALLALYGGGGTTRRVSGATMGGGGNKTTDAAVAHGMKMHKSQSHKYGDFNL